MVICKIHHRFEILMRSHMEPKIERDIHYAYYPSCSFTHTHILYTSTLNGLRKRFDNRIFIRWLYSIFLIEISTSYSKAFSIFLFYFRWMTMVLYSNRKLVLLNNFWSRLGLPQTSFDKLEKGFFYFNTSADIYEYVILWQP